MPLAGGDSAERSAGATSPTVTEPLVCDATVVCEQGQCEHQEDAVRVVCLPGRWMVAVADGCSGGPDQGAASSARPLQWFGCGCCSDGVMLGAFGV